MSLPGGFSRSGPDYTGRSAAAPNPLKPPTPLVDTMGEVEREFSLGMVPRCRATQG